MRSGTKIFSLVRDYGYETERGFREKKRRREYKGGEKKRIATVHKNSDNHHVWAYFQYNKINESLRVYIGSVGRSVVVLVGLIAALRFKSTDRPKIASMCLLSFRAFGLFISHRVQVEIGANESQMCVILRVCYVIFSLSLIISYFPFLFCHVFGAFLFCLTQNGIRHTVFFGREAEICVWIMLIKCKPMKYMFVVKEAYKFHWCQRIRAKKPTWTHKILKYILFTITRIKAFFFRSHFFS